ncbi:MAG: MOSC domain-containing protein, partial [Vicinamibacteria bacterium]|nr:MOSC domain-containing protein [Vicinamibacteria bacterium]
MPIKVGEVAALYRYPVKSMRGERLDIADLGWHGLEGDRRLAFRRDDDRGGFPWLTAGRLPELVLFAPQGGGAAAGADLPPLVRTPDGVDLETFGQDLAAEVGGRHGSPVRMTHLKHGIFDEASVSLLTSATVDEIGRLAAQPPDARRFRPNILMTSLRSVPFEEDAWVGGVLSFGEGGDTAAIGITLRDERCAMVNLDPDTAGVEPETLKAIVRTRQNKAGVYGAVVRRGRIEVGQPILF